jgi:G3E family GTPase
MSEKTPVSLVTGYLGSGKTTLISRLLRHPGMGETAVIVNEIGEIGIDHHILSRVDERTVLLSSGCLCCTLRGDLADELRDLVDRRDSGEIPPFRRVVVETTGLADPTPIVNTLLTEPLVRHHYMLDAVVATVDAVHGLRGVESEKQVAIADVLVLTKVDLVSGAGVAEQVARVNPLGDIIESISGDVDPDRLFDRPRHAVRTLPVDATRDGPRHDHEIGTATVLLDRPIDPTAFAIWLTMLLHARGPEILRVKGLLDIGEQGPLLVNAVQHVVHAPEHRAAWPDDDRRSRLVFIGRGLDADAIRGSLRAFDAAVPRTGPA